MYAYINNNDSNLRNLIVKYFHFMGSFSIRMGTSDPIPFIITYVDCTRNYANLCLAIPIITVNFFIEFKQLR